MSNSVHVTLTAFVLAIGFVLFVFMTSCNRNTSRDLTMEGAEYIITFVDDYNIEDFMSHYQEDIVKMSKTSKSKNSYLVRFKEQTDLKTINDSEVVIEIQLHEAHISTPTTHKAEKAKSAPIITNTK